jgi:hypothetical protein
MWQVIVFNMLFGGKQFAASRHHQRRLSQTSPFQGLFTKLSTGGISAVMIASGLAP